MRFSRQEYQSELPSPSPEDLPDPGMKPRTPTLQVDSLPDELLGKPVNKLVLFNVNLKFQNSFKIFASG